MALLLLVALLWAGVSATILISLVATALVIRPWDGSLLRTHQYAAEAPCGVFWWSSWLLWAADCVAGLKPAPMRLAELASAFTKSQVLFALVNLGLPDLLTRGPMTADQLAQAVAASQPPPPPGSPAAGPGQQQCNINVAWLERLLAAAASLGLLCRSTRRCRPAAATAATAAAAPSPELPVAGDASDVSDDGCGPSTIATAEIVIASPDTTKQGLTDKAAASSSSSPASASTSPTSPAGGGLEVVYYSLTALSAALTRASPANVSSFVRLLEYDCQAMTHLSQGLLTGVVPFQLASGGRPFWESLAADEAHEATFDVAMLQKRHIGGRALVTGYPWGRFDTIIDVAGGVGTFTADLLSAHPKLKAVVLDQQQQIARGKKVWAADHQELLPRVDLVAGDIFNSDTIPAPEASVAYVLYDILHNWPDAAALAILRCIRQAAERRNNKDANVKLLLVEVTKSRDVLPCNLPFRCCSDVAMMTLFGDGAERDTAQFRRLLAAAGWQLGRLVPTNGIFIILEASPAPTGSSSGA